MTSYPKKGEEHVTDTMDAPADDFAVGTQRDIPKRYTSKTFYRSVLFQMILFGLLSLVGPAMSDAITNLGGGGLSQPWLANLSTSLSYLMSFFSTIIGGPIINKIGIKWACLIAAVAMPLHGSGYYVCARFGTEWYLIASNVVKGLASGLLYVGETTAMLSYPHPQDKGFYLGVWSAMRSSGSVIGGAINFSTNHDQAKAGGVVWATYLIFIAFECTGLIWALLLSQTAKVRRRDNSKIELSEQMTWKQEFMELGRYLREKRTWLVFVPAFYSFFYGGTMGTYLALHFSVRARALSSFLVPTVTIPSVVLFGKLLDTQFIKSQRKRAWVAMVAWVIPQSICFVFVALEYHWLGNKSALDYGTDTTRWAKAYLPYFFIFITGYWTQLQLYWILGTFSNKTSDSSRSGGVFRAFEVIGQSVSYGLSSSKTIGPVVPLYINIAVLILTIPTMAMLIGKVPHRPLAEQQVVDVKDVKDVEQN